MEQVRGVAITLEQLIALNEEIGALMRAGVPLEQGLSHLGQDMPGRLGKLAGEIAERLQRGEALSDVFRVYAAEIPPVYRAVVEAGARSGRLAAALESVAASAQRTADMRSLVAGAIAYPLLVFLLGWGLLVGFVAEIVPRFLPVFEGFDAYGLAVLEKIAVVGESVVYWGPAVPAVILLVAGTWWYQTARGAMAEPRLAALFLSWLPGVGRVLRLQRVATFVEILALLAENQVPLDQGLLLAADACGDSHIARSARAMAAAIARGEPLESADGGFRDFPPLVQWMMVAGQQRGTLVASLRHAAEMYRNQASHRAAVVRIHLPVLMTVFLGGGVTVLYVMLLMGPWIAMLRGLARP